MIEPNPDAFNLLLHKNRNVWSIKACISTRPVVEIKQFDALGVFGGTLEKGIGPTKHQVNIVRTAHIGIFMILRY